MLVGIPYSPLEGNWKESREHIVPRFSSDPGSFHRDTFPSDAPEIR